MSVAFQDQMRDNYCWGCGADNPDGLLLKSYWNGDIASAEWAVAEWQPHRAHAAGPRHILNGGVIATLLDCLGVGTAMADAYRRDDRPIGSDPEIWYATAALAVEYLRPTPLAAPVSMRARVAAIEDRHTTVECVLEAQGKPRARASVRAVRVPDDWRHGAAGTPAP